MLTSHLLAGLLVTAVLSAAADVLHLLDAGSQHTCVVRKGAALCFGDGREGQISGSSQSSNIPVQVPGLETGVSEICASNKFSCAIQNSAVKCWGSRANGRLGDGGATTGSSATPVDVSTLAGNVEHISCFNDHACAIQNGALRCWGAGTDHQLGGGANVDSAVPVNVLELTSNVTLVATGGRSTCAVHLGQVKCFGKNANFQLGNGNMDDQPVAVAVAPALTGVRSLACGTSHCCVVLETGTVKCWGENSAGNLGDASTTTRSSPTDVVGIVGATTVCAGDAFSCVVTQRGVRCFGTDRFSQLGNGATSGDQSTPVDVSGMSPRPEVGADTTLTVGAYSVTCGFEHACAVHDNRVQCWGLGLRGGLGNGQNTEADVPVAAQGLDSFLQQPPGAVCAQAADCESAICLAGRCCAASYTQCEACAASTGLCERCSAGFFVEQQLMVDQVTPTTVCAVQRPVGAACGGSDQCSGGDCRGGGCCAASVAASTPQCSKCDGQGTCSACSEGTYLYLGQCVAKREPGLACLSNEECASNDCRGGALCCAPSTATECTLCAPSGKCIHCKPPHVVNASDGTCRISVGGGSGAMLIERAMGLRGTLQGGDYWIVLIVFFFVGCLIGCCLLSLLAVYARSRANRRESRNRQAAEALGVELGPREHRRDSRRSRSNSAVKRSRSSSRVRDAQHPSSSHVTSRPMPTLSPAPYASTSAPATNHYSKAPHRRDNPAPEQSDGTVRYLRTAAEAEHGSAPPGTAVSTDSNYQSLPAVAGQRKSQHGKLPGSHQ